MIENTIICGPAEQVLPTIPTGSINCSISSPPYWALRDYGVDGQLGLEKTFEEYIDKLCTIYDEVKRVLRDDGTCFVNLGDSYAGSGGEHKPWHKSDSSFQHKGGFSKYALTHEFTKPRGDFGRQGKTSKVSDRSHSGRCYDNSLPAKSLCLIPQRFAIEMVSRGWVLRNCLIWHKPNPMPSSAKDRFTVDFEYVYFFVKQRSYFFEPQYEPHKSSYEAYEKAATTIREGRQKHPVIAGCPVNETSFAKPQNPLGRNKRTVWTIPTQAYPDAHFATFPEKLVEPMILSGCPKEVCTKCGQGRRKIIEATGGTIGQDWNQHNIEHPNGRDPNKTQKVISAASNGTYKKTFKGYTDCGCGEKFRPGIVLDPFVGRARLARSLPSKDATGSELNLSRSISKWRCAA